MNPVVKTQAHETVISPLYPVLGALPPPDVELRVVSRLWPLRDAVHASTLVYSFIRIRHAQPRRACLLLSKPP